MALDPVLITAVAKARESCDMAVIDLPGTNLGICMEGKKAVIMALCRKLTELMVLTALNIYCKYVMVDKKGDNVLYVKMANALYGLLQSALLMYLK